MMMMNSKISESRESTEFEEQEAGGRYHDDEDNGLKSNNEIELTRIRLMRDPLWKPSWIPPPRCHNLP